MAQLFHFCRVMLAEFMAKPTIRSPGGYHTHTFVTYGSGAGEPARLLANFCRGIRNHNCVKTLWGKTSQPKPRQAAH